MENDDKLITNKPDQAKRLIRYVVAGITIIVLSIVVIEGWKFYRLSNERLFQEKYSDYVVSATIKADSSETRIQKAYREKNYAEVIRLNESSVLTVNDIFLSALSYLEKEDAAKAVSNFQVVLANLRGIDNRELKDVTEYYLALAYLRNSDYDQAIELMNAINANSSHRYQKKYTRGYISKVERLKWR